MLRIGLLGAGGMAGVYADRIADMADVSVAAVASPNTAASFVADHTPSATAYADAETLCTNADVDAVAVVSPTHTHRDLLEIAADHGLDAICEKPLARTLDDAHEIRECVNTSEITVMVAHATRFFPEYATAKRRVDAGVIGTPGVARTKRAFGFSGSRGWFDDPEKSGGVALDLAIHDFDFLRWTLGDVQRVFSRQVAWANEGTSEVSLTTLRFESGTVGHVETWAVEDMTVPFTTAFELAGDEGHIEFDLDDVRPVTRYDDEGAFTPRDPVADDLPLRRDGYRRLLDHFAECVETGAEPLVGIEGGTASLRVSLAAIESAERGEPVAVAEVTA